MADSPASPPSSSGLHSGEPADDHDASCLPIGTRLGEFELTGLIGIGGFGIVYSARDHLLEREVAIKEYMPSALASRTADYRVTVKSERHQETFGVGLRSFVNEAKLLAQFDHPSLVKVFRFWEANGTAYMVMPYYRGTTLRSALKSLGEAPDETAVLQMLRPLLDALDVIHAGNCYHRDIAPDNILILESGRPVLLDFGAARRVIGDFTQALTVILKPGFAPVEQYANGPEMRQGPWTDIYALAAVLYYCIGGKTPTPSVSRMMRDTMVPARELGKGRYSESFLAAIDHALAVHIEERTASVTQLRTELGLEEIVEKSSRTRLGVGPAAAAVPAPAAAAAPVADAASPVTPVDTPIQTPIETPATAPVTAGSSAPPSAASPAQAPSEAARTGTPIEHPPDPDQMTLPPMLGTARAPGTPAVSPTAAPAQPQRLVDLPDSAVSPAPAKPAEDPLGIFQDSAHAPTVIAPPSRAQASSERRGPVAAPPQAPSPPAASASALQGPASPDLARPPPTSATSAPDAAASPTPKRKGLAIAAVAAVLVLGGGGAWLMWKDAPTQSSSKPPERAAPELTQKSGAGSAPPSATGSPSTSSATAAPAGPPAGTAGSEPPALATNTSPPAAATASAAAFSPQAVIESLHELRDPSWPVSVKLRSDTLRIDRDNLQFRVTSARAGHLYVIQVGTDSAHFWQLFPNGSDRANRIEANRELVLPRSSWSVLSSGPAGMNRLIAIVTPSPRDFSAAGLQPTTASSFIGEFDLGLARNAWARDGPSAFAGKAINCTLDAAACARFGAARFDIREVN